MIESHTAVLERQVSVSEAYETEPYETAWAREAILFAREHGEVGGHGAHFAEVEISPDGINWCADGAVLAIEPGRLTHVKLTHFGGWLRIRGRVPRGAELTLSVHLMLKG